MRKFLISENAYYTVLDLEGYKAIKFCNNFYQYANQRLLNLTIISISMQTYQSL
jgi:hypothetical protein